MTASAIPYTVTKKSFQHCDILHHVTYHLFLRQ